jgi:hypothetical protein
MPLLVFRCRLVHYKQNGGHSPPLAILQKNLFFSSSAAIPSFDVVGVTVADVAAEVAVAVFPVGVAGVSAGGVAVEVLVSVGVPVSVGVHVSVGGVVTGEVAARGVVAGPVAVGVMAIVSTVVAIG